MTSKRKHHGKHPEHPEHADDSAAPEAAMPAADDPPQAQAPGGAALVEAPEQEIKRLAEQLEAAKDQHLRLAAEYDNYRKRTIRERAELNARAQAEVVSSILDALDDLGRVAHLDANTVSAKDVVAGVELVERKILRELEGAGMVRVGQVGEKFDPHAHEALGSVPATAPEQDHTVANVFQPGYKFGGALIRPARVQVYLWQDPAGAEG